MPGALSLVVPCNYLTTQKNQIKMFIRLIPRPHINTRAHLAYGELLLLFSCWKDLELCYKTLFAQPLPKQDLLNKHIVLLSFLGCLLVGTFLLLLASIWDDMPESSRWPFTWPRLLMTIACIIYFVKKYAMLSMAVLTMSLFSN